MTGFWEAINSFVDHTAEPVEYRVYYDKHGAILFYTTEKLDGEYLTITLEEYTLGRYDLKVKNGKLVNPAPGSRKLVPSDTGVITDKDNITIITNVGQSWAIKDYENND